MKHVVLWQKQLLGLFESATELISDQKYKVVELKLEILIKTTKNAKNVPRKTFTFKLTYFHFHLKVLFRLDQKYKMAVSKLAARLGRKVLPLESTSGRFSQWAVAHHLLIIDHFIDRPSLTIISK